jgi:uncharacterized damage-inducible protein DinB
MATSLPLPRRPAPDEYAPFYAGYVAQVGDDPIAQLAADGAAWGALLAAIPDARGSWRYGPDKWSIKEVVGHVIDTERIMSYRLLRLAREDATPLPGFDENAYVPHAGSDARPLADLAAELEAVRRATLALVRSIAPTALDFRGTASGQPMTARALLWIVAGHATHHRRIVEERYL